MPDVVKWRLPLEVRREHLGIHAISLRGRAVFILVLVLVGAAIEVRWSLVLVGPAMIGVPCDQVAHVARRILIELLVAAEYKDCDIDGAEDG